MKKILSLIVFQFLFVAGRCQSLNLPSALLQNIDSSRIISFCECIHGSDQIAKTQLAFVTELQKNYTIGAIFFESNNLYLGKRKMATDLKMLDSTIKLIGYNPGLLYSSYQMIKKSLANSNPDLIHKLSSIFNKLDSNEAYYWYLLQQNEYDSLLQQLNLLKAQNKDTLYQDYINQLHFDLTYLKYRKIFGDKIRDSLMFSFIYENIGQKKLTKYIIFGHCGHIAMNNPYHLNNLGFYLKKHFSKEFLVIGNDSRTIHLVDNLKPKKHQKRTLLLGHIPIEGIFVSTSLINKKSQRVYLVGADYNLSKKYKLDYSLNYDWLYYLDDISVILTN